MLRTLGPLLLGAAALARPAGDTVVTVVGPGGRGLPKVALELFTADGERVRALATDFAGRAVLEQVPWDGSMRIRCHELGSGGLRQWVARRWRRPWAPVTGPAVELIAKTGLPLRLEPVDAVSGERVRGATWRSYFGVLLEDLESVAEDGPHTWFGRPGESDTLILRVGDVPDGFVAWDPYRREIHTSRFARALVARYPLRREALAWVEVGGSGPLAYGFRTAGGVRNSQVGERDSRGRLRLRGVPFHPGVPLEVMVTEQVPEGWAEGAIVVDPHRELFRRDIGDTPYAFHAIPGAAIVEGALPTEVESRLVLQARLPDRGAEPAAWPFCPMGGRSIVVRGGGPPPPQPFPREAGDSVTVRVLRRDGEPASGARIAIRHGSPGVRQHYLHADAEGIARFEGISGGWALFQIIEPGMVRTSSGRVVPAGEVVLREGEGGTLAVRVTDARGRGLPFACLRVETESMEHVRGPVHSWIDEQAGVQRVDPYADRDGCRTYLHVTPGHVEILATWLERSGRATARVESGKTTEVVVSAE